MKARSTGKSTIMRAHIFIINNWNQSPIKLRLSCKVGEISLKPSIYRCTRTDFTQLFKNHKLPLNVHYCKHSFDYESSRH